MQLNKIILSNGERVLCNPCFCNTKALHDCLSFTMCLEHGLNCLLLFESIEKHGTFHAECWN